MTDLERLVKFLTDVDQEFTTKPCTARSYLVPSGSTTVHWEYETADASIVSVNAHFTSDGRFFCFM